MAAWRCLGAVGFLLAVVPLAPAQTYPLAEEVKVGDCCRYHLEMTLSGDMKVNRDGKEVPLKLAASATHDFPERILGVSNAGVVEKAARVYETARSSIGVGAERSERTLRPERHLIVAERHAEGAIVYAPAGPLTSEEVELTGEHFDTLTLTGLLPGKPVAVGDTWKVPNTVAEALCSFEGLTEQSLTCKLEEVKDNIARVSVTGPASGIDVGALVKLTVQASYRFDLGSKHLIGVEWQQTDERDQGPANPASSVQTTTTLTRTPIEQPSNLDNVSLVSVPDGEPPAAMLQLEYRDPQGRFSLTLGREWHLVGRTDEHVILRMMEQGDFVAQLTVTPWTQAARGQHMSPDEFKGAMARTPGWEPDRDLQAGEMPLPKGDDRWIYRMSAVGKMDGIEVLQNFYLVAAPDGEQVVLLFTLVPKKAPKLGERDLSLAASVDFPHCKAQK